MPPGLMEPVVQTNGKVPVPEVPDGLASHQPFPAPSSSPVNEHVRADRAERLSQAETTDKNGCKIATEPPPHKSQAILSCGVPCDCSDFDPTKSPPQINTILQASSSHVARKLSNHDNIAVSSESIEPRSSASPVPSEAVQTPSFSADFQPVEDDPVYNVGQMKIFDQKQKAITKPYEARWQIIRPDIFDRVETRLRRGRFAVRLNKPRAPTIIELMSAGVDKARSMPAVVVLIPKHIKAMQNFLDKDSMVQSRCKPEDGTTVELLVLACRGSSTLIGVPGGPLQSDEGHSSDSDDSGEYSDDDSSLSSPGDADSSGALHSATSMLEVDTRSMSVVCEERNTDGNGKYGMSIRLITKDGSRAVRGTCGGFLQLSSHNQPPKQVGLIAGHLLEQLGQGPEESHHETVEIHCNIGEILHPKISTEIPLHDWALFDAGKLKISYSMVAQSDTAIAQGLIVTKGDSGAWVYGCGKVYGYVIAANGNGHTYMVPMHAAITEMRLSLGAVSISLVAHMDNSGQVRLSKTHGHDQQTRSPQDSESASEADISSIRNEIQRLKARAGKYLDDGQAAQAIMWLQTGVSIQERLFEEDPIRLAWQHKLGKAYIEIGLVPEAISILKEIVKVREEVLEGEHADNLAAQHELAVAYIQNGQASEAITLLKKVVATEAGILDEHHISRLTSQHELARAYLADGQASEAIKILEHVVAVKSETLETSDPHLLASQIVLAEANLRAGRALGAVTLLETVFDAATGTSSEHKKIRTQSREWLTLARRHLSGTGSQRPVGQVSKPLSIFLKPRR